MGVYKVHCLIVLLVSHECLLSSLFVLHRVSTAVMYW